jgi:hypothetical protein
MKRERLLPVRLAIALLNIATFVWPAMLINVHATPAQSEEAALWQRNFDGWTGVAFTCRSNPDEPWMGSDTVLRIVRRLQRWLTIAEKRLACGEEVCSLAIIVWWRDCSIRRIRLVPCPVLFQRSHSGPFLCRPPSRRSNVPEEAARLSISNSECFQRTVFIQITRCEPTRQHGKCTS